MELNWNFQRGGGIQTKKPSVGGVWIFSGTIHSLKIIYYNPNYTLFSINIQLIGQLCSKWPGSS